jgi:hypothetical protein
MVAAIAFFASGGRALRYLGRVHDWRSGSCSLRCLWTRPFRINKQLVRSHDWSAERVMWGLPSLPALAGAGVRPFARTGLKGQTR